MVRTILLTSEPTKARKTEDHLYNEKLKLHSTEQNKQLPEKKNKKKLYFESPDFLAC